MSACMETTIEITIRICIQIFKINVLQVTLTSKPFFILFPESEAEIVQVVKCANSLDLSVKVRSGGHSYEGLSSTSDVPFVIIDLKNWNKVVVNVEEENAVVQTGATLGDIYYYISTVSNGTYGFTAGSCPTVGSGGHISGGGFGLLSRKYGLAADNVIDITFLDYAGNIYTRNNASEDLYWALRGGGGGTFGIVLSWTIKILPVPAQVVVFNKVVTGRMEALEYVYNWQYVGLYFDDDFYMSVFISGTNSTTVQHRRPLEMQSVAEDIQAIFHGQSLVGVEETLETINNAFPQLQLNESDLLTMTWIESIVYFSGLPANSSIEALLERNNPNKGMFKAKSDYVQNHNSREGIAVAFEYLQDNPNGYIILDPYGAKMWEIPADEIPFPHCLATCIPFSIRWYGRMRLRMREYRVVARFL